MALALHVAFDVSLEDLLEAPRRLRARRVAPLSFFGAETSEPSVIGWMPAAAVCFRDPDGHQLEYLTMLADAPSPTGAWCPGRSGRGATGARGRKPAQRPARWSRGDRRAGRWLQQVGAVAAPVRDQLEREPGRRRVDQVVEGVDRGRPGAALQPSRAGTPEDLGPVTRKPPLSRAGQGPSHVARPSPHPDPAGRRAGLRHRRSRGRHGGQRAARAHPRGAGRRGGLAAGRPATRRSRPPARPPRRRAHAREAPRERIRWRRSVAVGAPAGGRLLRGVRLPAESESFVTWDPVKRRSPNRAWRRWGTDRLVRLLLTVAREYACESASAADGGQ